MTEARSIIPEGFEVTEFEVDTRIPVVVLHGIKYQMSLFKALAEDPFGSIIEIAGRDDGVVGMKRHFPDADGWIRIGAKKRSFYDKLQEIETDLQRVARELNADNDYETAARAQGALIAVSNIAGGDVDFDSWEWDPA